MRRVLLAFAALAATFGLEAEEQSAQAETLAYKICAETYVDRYATTGEPAKDVASAALGKCQMIYTEMLEAIRQDLYNHAGSSVESRQRADRWAQGSADTRKDVILQLMTARAMEHKVK